MKAAWKDMWATRRRQGDNAEDCPVCLTGFDDSVQRPRTLPCGHTVCTLCIDKLKEQDHVTCPECRIRHTVPEGGQFPISYTLEAVIKRLKDAELAAAAASPPPRAGKGKRAAGEAGKKEATGISKKMRSFLQEQEAMVLDTITASQEAQSQLDQYQTTLTEWGEQQQHLQARLLGLVDQTKSAWEFVQQEKSRAAAKKEEVKTGEQELHVVLEALRTPKTEQEAGLTVANVFRCTGEADQGMKECQESFPDANIVTYVRKVREASTAALEAAQAVQADLETLPTVTTEDLRSQPDPEELMPQLEPDSTIIDRLQLILTPSLKGSLQAKDLHSLTQPTKRLLKAGQVFAAHQVEGQCRYARISFEAGRLYLHALKGHPPPPDAAILQVSEIMPPSPPCIAFLDLSWPGSAPRRVQVYLSPDTPRGREFMLLCTGHRGPCYANTKLFEVGDKGHPGECVWGGDCERNNGWGRITLIPDIDEGVYRESHQAGDVYGVYGVGGQFGILTKDRLDLDEWTIVFGEVVDGLHVLEEAVQLSNIMEVTVVDCGVELWEGYPAPPPPPPQ